MVQAGRVPIMIENWRWVVDSMPQLVWVADRDGKVLYFNRRVHDLGGVFEDEYGAWQWTSAVHPDDAKRSTRAWYSSIETGAPFLVEHRLRMSGGDHRWHISHAELTTLDGDDPLWFGITTDVHDQKLTEQALRESETRFREVANGTPLPIWMHDEEGHQVFVNTSFVDYFGIDPIEAIADGSEPWIDLTHPDDRQPYLNEFMRCVRDRAPFHAAVRVRRHDGSWRWLESWASPRFSDDGTYCGHIGTSADVSDRQRAEEVLRLAHRDESRRRRNAELIADVIARLEEAATARIQAQLLADSLVPRFADRVTVAFPGIGDPVVVGEAGSVRSTISAEIRTNAGEPGGVTVARIDPSRKPYDHLDVEFLQNLAGRVGVSFKAAMLRSQEHLIASRLQQALLPARRLERPDVEIATRYVTAVEVLEVGGDWYETFELDDGRIGVSVGDVVGHNLEAAAAMGQLRAGMLALAARSASPGRLLAELDLFAHRYGITDFATASCAFIDPVAGELHYASAGHPSMLVVLPDGTAEWLEGALAPPIGSMMVTDRPDARTAFPRGSTLIAYSDGLVERRDQEPDRGRERLHHLVLSAGRLPLEELCDRIIQAMAGPSPYADDVALVCLRICDAVD
jgi:PAS domain S-box-containing protein